MDVSVTQIVVSRLDLKREARHTIESFSSTTAAVLSDSSRLQ